MTCRVVRAAARLAALSALVLLAGCASASSTAAGTSASGTGSSTAAAVTTTGDASRRAYAALGASETFGVGASPITNGYAYQLRDALHLGAADFADVAIPGANLADAYQPELTNALAIRPTVTTVFFGVNDIRSGIPLTQFTSDLTDMVATLRRAGARVLVIGVPELADLPALRSLPNADLTGVTRQWNAAMQRVAIAGGATFLSLDAFSAELTTHPDDIAADGLHPSNVGHARLAQLVLATLEASGLVSA